MLNLFKRGEQETADASATQKPTHLINLRQVVKAYNTPVGDFIALRGVDLQIDRGEFVAVIGKSGSGKTTLINMITGIDKPSSGEINIGGIPVHTLREGPMAEWRGRNVGVIFQFFQLLPMLSCIENIMLPMDFCNLYNPRERKDRAMHLLQQVGLEEHAFKLPSEISGGQQQRVAIARALANDPPILVADEPTGNLDSRTAVTIFNLFEDLVNQGKTILMVTHDQDLAKRVSRTIIIADGEIIDEYLAKTFTAIQEKKLIEASRKLEPQTFNPGQVIINQGDHPDKFYIITKGYAEVLLQEPDGQQIVIARLQHGQYFGEIGLLRGGTRIATVRASFDSGVEVVALDKETFEELVGESPITREELDRIAHQRTSETESKKTTNGNP
ncbi:MAG: ATP-binding cassette domain-containing protein [Ardenticatenaceae bacterium]|nr:ATP-binding cassette domain-containing protein [Ardenticatenaceae bacterium]